MRASEGGASARQTGAIRRRSRRLRQAQAADTRRFYDEIGWQVRQGRAVDSHLFSYREDGPLRRHLNGVYGMRIALAVRRAGERVKMLECGCGGNPALNLLPLCSEYHGLDFSQTGLQRAADLLRGAGTPWTLRNADIAHLPYEDARFDAVYCAHVLYHIPHRAEQQAALREMMRVLRPGGVLVLITANPHPMLFPLRLAKRLLAEVPGVRSVAGLLGYRGVLPYEPPPLRWLKRRLAPLGDIEIVSHGICSTYVHQRVTEFSGLGKRLWRLLSYLDVSFAHAAAYLGNYAQVTVVKSAAREPAQ
jgi:SAM-dependent methyltransferase